MFNSPARATPRRGIQSRTRDASSRASIFSADGAGVGASATPSIASSRLSLAPSTSARGYAGSSAYPPSPTSSAGDTVHTVTTVLGAHQRNGDEWDREKVCWSRDERHTVLAAGHLPTEVQGLVNGADFIVHSVAAQLDPLSGFALVSSPSVCMAWNYVKRTQSSPTVYAFPAPQATRTSLATVPPSLAAFFGAPGAEPGLVLVSATGQVRFWESMSLALANVARFQTLQLDLGSSDDDEFAERIWRVDAGTFIITTTSSLAFRLSIINSGGRLVPTAAPFTRPGGMFGRASTTIFPGRDDKTGVAAVVATQGGAYLLGKRTLQKWNIGLDGVARLVQEFDLHESIGASLFDDEKTWLSGSVSLELNDLVAVGSDQLAALVSYAQQQPGSSEYHRVHNSHAIVLFENHTRSNTLTISNIVHISYLAHPDPRMLDVPRLYIPHGSHTAFIRFADAIVMASLSDTPYEDTITLRDSARNAFIGIGAVSGPAAQHLPASSSLSAMSSLGGIMSVEVHEAGPSQKLSSAASATARLKSKIEQAVFFGDRSDNPITFDLPAGFQGDVAEAAESVSAEIVSSSSPYMPGIFELRPQLIDRLARLKEIMTFIHRNGALSLLPQGSRRRLSSDAEKVKASIELWDYQNRLMDKLHSRSPQSLLADSIVLLMNQLGKSDGDDVVRLFFRSQVRALDILLETVFATFKAAISSAGIQSDVSAWVLEANRIYIIALRSSFQLREDEISTYQVNRLNPVVELWTAQDAIVNDLESLYASTQKLIKDRTRQFGSVVDEIAPQGAAATPHVARQRDQATLKWQMAQLAAALCGNMEDKLRASATRQLNGGADPTDGLTLGQRWDDLKPRIIRPLVEIDRVSEAYELAEHHRDFPTLVYLCHHPIATSGPARMQQYIERFGSEFAFVLYQWYIDQGQLHALLSQDEVYGSLLTSFFETHPHPELAWAHQLASKRYGDAATSLVAVDGKTAQLAQKHLVSSIAKLAAVAEIKTHGDSAARKDLLIEIDDGLDMVYVQNALRDAILDVAPTTGYPRAPSADGYVSSHATILASRPAFAQLLLSLVSSLVAGDALDVESLIDVLTLKDNVGDVSERDAAVALERLARDSALPEGRKQVALLSIWRRVFIRDDWTMIANTTGRSEEAQRDLLRGTLTYATLRAIGSSDLPPNYVLSPYTATQSPLLTELSARFPHFTPENISALMVDHEDEIATLERLLETAALEERVRAVSELVASDALEGSEDIVM